MAAGTKVKVKEKCCLAFIPETLCSVFCEGHKESLELHQNKSIPRNPPAARDSLIGGRGIALQLQLSEGISPLHSSLPATSYDFERHSSRKVTF